MSFYNYLKIKIENMMGLKDDLSCFFDVKGIEIIELPQNEIVIAIAVNNKAEEVFITTELSGISEVYSKDTVLETTAKNYLTSLKRDFKIEQILNSRNK